MYFYQISGTAFQSNIPLPELTDRANFKPEFKFELHTKNKRHSRSYLWLNYWYSLDGRIWLAFAKIETGYLLRFPAYADFVVSKDGDSIAGFRRSDTSEATIRHLLLNQVIPIVLSQLGKLVLHASACVTPQGVMAFMGTTGMGKSTLAASFGLRGLAVLTDDCLSVEKWDDQARCVPSYSGIRLWPESVAALFEAEPELQALAHYTDKKRFVFSQEAAGDSLLLKAVYVLAYPDESQPETTVSITPLLPSDALLQAVRHTFQMDVTDRTRLTKAFRRYEWLAHAVPFFKLSYPREHTALPEVNMAILDHMSQLQDWERIPA